MAGSRSLWREIGSLWGAEPLDRRKTQTNLSTSLLATSYKYDNSETGIPTVIVTLLPWMKQLSGKIYMYAVQHYCWRHGRKITATEDNGCLPFTWKNRLVNSCSKWYSWNPKWKFSVGCACSISTTFPQKITSKTIQAKRPRTSRN